MTVTSKNYNVGEYYDPIAAPVNIDWTPKLRCRPSRPARLVPRRRPRAIETNSILPMSSPSPVWHHVTLWEFSCTPLCNAAATYFSRFFKGFRFSIFVVQHSDNWTICDSGVFKRLAFPFHSCITNSYTNLAIQLLPFALLSLHTPLHYCHFTSRFWW